MRISIIAACARNRVIGKHGSMPWHLPAELAHFKQLTMGKPIIMGRRTFESIGRTLPGRRNIVLTRDSAYRAPGAVVAHTIEDSLAAASGSQEAMIIGGGHLYRQLLTQAERLYLTVIEADIEGDTFFPEWSENEWVLREEVYRASDEKNKYAMSFLFLDRK
jgi:dihydrofolate reductase